MSKQSKFRFRPFVSLLTAFSFVAIIITAAILYITPPGRVANWTNWTILGLSKHQWGAVHICFGVVFLIVSLLHIWLNIKPLMSYFVRKAQTASKLQTEWILALAVCILVFWGSLEPFVPFSSLLDLNDRIKNSWEKPQQQPPIPHAETLTLAELAKKSDIELDTITQNLKAAGIEVTPSDIFGTIAEQQNLSPNELFEMAAGQQTEPVAGGHSEGGGGGGSGFGQKTLKQACEEIGIEPEKAIEGLKAAGINAAADMRIREIADRNNTRPGQIREILENL